MLFHLLYLNLLYSVLYCCRIKYQVYDKNCSEGGVIVSEWFDANLVSPQPEDPQRDGTSLNLMNLTIFVDPASFDEAPAGVSDQ